MATATAPLAGFTVGVTAARRRDELAVLLRRRGARVVEARSAPSVPAQDADALRRATELCLTAPLDYVVATAGVDWHGWMSAADGWGLGRRLGEACREAVVLSGGPKGGPGGPDESLPAGSKAGGELLTWLLARDLRGSRIAVQEHDGSMAEFIAALRERGAEVLSVPVHRQAPPTESDPVRRLVEQTARGEIQAIAFTSVSASTGFLEAAAGQGLLEQLLGVLRRGPERGGVLPVCVEPACARPLEEHGVTPTCPDRGRTDALVRAMVQALPRGNRELRLAEHRLTLQGSVVLVSGQCLWLSPVQAALLRALAEQPGEVLSRTELLRRVWAGGAADEHAVEAAVARLRGALGPYAALVRTVPKRGYRLAVTR
jgi:uroporphyrinogen-III synthase